MELYGLILIEFIFFIISYKMFDNDIIAPPVMTFLVVLIGTIMVIPSVEIWQTHISTKTIFVISLGSIFILMGSLLSKQTFGKRNINIQRQEMKVIHCSRIMEMIFLLGSLTFTILYLLEAIRVGSLLGGSGFGAIAYMKNEYISDHTEIRMNMVIRQGFKIVMLFSYISVFLFSNNVLVLKEKLIRNICYLVSIACGCAITIFSGSRTEMLRILSAMLLCYSILIREQKGWKRKENSKSILKIIKKFAIPSLIVIIVAFASRAIVKMENVATSGISSILSYVSYYLGSPVQVLNLKLEYFDGMDELLFGTSVTIPEFVYLGNLNYGGNVATIFESVIGFNGLVKMVLFLFLIFFIGTSMYYHLYGSYSSMNRNRFLVSYAYIYFAFTMSYYANCFYLLIMFSNYIVLIFLYVSFKFLLKTKIRLHR